VVSCPNYHSLQNYAVLDSPKTTSFCPKRRNFRHFRFYLFLFFIFEKKKKNLKKKKKKKKKGNRGGFGHPIPATPYRLYGGGFGHPLRPVGGGRSHPQALGGGPATPKILNPFFCCSVFFFFFLPFRVAEPPSKA
jgi:hypothetical protein